MECGTETLSMWDLKFVKVSKNYYGLFINFPAAFHDLSLTLPYLSTSTEGSIVASKNITAAVTSSTPGGGVFKAFASWKSFLLKVSKAA